MFASIRTAIVNKIMSARWKREQRRATEMLLNLRMHSYANLQPGWVFQDQATEKSTCLARIGGSIWAEKPEYPVDIETGSKLLADKGIIAYGPVSTKVA